MDGWMIDSCTDSDPLTDGLLRSRKDATTEHGGAGL